MRSTQVQIATQWKVSEISLEREVSAMNSIAAKEVLFIYNGDEKKTEIEFDANGDFPCSIDGSIVKQRGRQWKVAGARAQSPTSGAKAMQVLRIDLTDRFRGLENGPVIPSTGCSTFSFWLCCLIRASPQNDSDG